MRRRLLLAGLALVVAGTACHGRPIPMSAQAGSTIVIPLSDSEHPGLLPLAKIGFGGSSYEDPQRGSLVAHLDDASGFALETRIAFIATPPVESTLGPSGGPFGRSLLLVVDIPTNAPLGYHDLVLVNERVVDGTPESTVVTPAPITIAILPNVVSAGGQNVVGTPTQEIFYLGTQALPFEDGVVSGNLLHSAVPPPSFGLRVSTANGQVPTGQAGRFVAYAKVDLAYPRDTIDIVRVVATNPAEQLVWWEDDRVGGLRVYVVARNAVTATGVGAVRVVFGLDDPADTLDLGEISVTSFEARDQTGLTTIKSEWALVASTSAIR